MTIFNLRGGNGAGKTTIHHWLIDEHDAEPMYDPNFFTGVDKKPNAWKLPGENGVPLYIIGKYTGGADSILFDTLRTHIRGFSQHGHVFFENVLVSGGKNAWLRTRRTMSDEDWIWATLDTPPEVCLARIYERNGGKPIQEETIINFNARVRMLQEWLATEGETSLLIDYRSSIYQMHSILKQYGWNCGVTHEWEIESAQ